MQVMARKMNDGRETLVTLYEVAGEKIVRKIGQKVCLTGWVGVRELLQEAGLPPALFADANWRPYRVEHTRTA